MSPPLLPESHLPYTDKYFIRTRRILEKENINPRVSLNVFTRGSGAVAGLEEAVAIFQKYSDLKHQKGELWITNKKTYSPAEPLMIIKGPVQSLVELETIYLGVISQAISRAAGYAPPEPKQIKEKLQRLKGIYGDIPIIYFGARHYHWSLDEKIAAAALEGGAVQTSTDIGSSNIHLKGAGTTPHLLTIVLASVYGKEKATLKTAECFDKHMPPEIPRVTLVDTFNREITDGLAVARYFGTRKNALRVDTCGENIGQSGSPYQGKKQPDPTYQTGTGVSIQVVVNLKKQLIKEGFGQTTGIFLSSGFGNETKAQAFMDAHNRFKAETGLPLFQGLGIGEVSTARFCTADIFQVQDKPIAKTGREAAGCIDYSTLKRVI